MPEGPEIKTVARTLAEKLIGKELGSLWHSQHQLRRPVDYRRIKKLENTVIDDISCYGKVLFISANQEPILVAQLGMTGQLRVDDVKAPVADHTHIRWRLKHCHQELRYVDPRRFGLFDACSALDKQNILGRLGPDPFFMKKNDIESLIKTMKRSSRAIKEVLLDQAVIAGVGNIYASEALFLARIDPTMRAADIEPIQYDRLIPAIIEVMELAYKNCGTTFSNYVDGSGQKGENLAFLKVFQREAEPCTKCKTPIARIKQSGRSTFLCPTCQK